MKYTSLNKAKNKHPKILNTNAYIALEVRPNSFSPIDTRNLDFANNKFITDLALLDNFTKDFTVDEIKTLIQKANIVKPEDLAGELVISYKMRKLPILTKEIFSEFDIFIFANSYINKKIINQIYSKAKIIASNNLTFKARLAEFETDFKNLDNKPLRNIEKSNVLNSLSSLEEITEFTAAARNQYNNFFLKIFNCLEYEEKRRLYFYIHKNIFINIEEKNSKRVREKIGEVA